MLYWGTSSPRTYMACKNSVYGGRLRWRLSAFRYNGVYMVWVFLNIVRHFGLMHRIENHLSPVSFFVNKGKLACVEFPTP